jgi:hypothetical protein
LKEWTTPDFRNTPSATNLEKEEIVDAPRNDGNASMPEEVNRPNLWRKMMMIMTPWIYMECLHLLATNFRFLFCNVYTKL